MHDERMMPRAGLAELIRGRARLVGARLDPELPRGVVSPIEARIVMGLPYGDLRAQERSYLTGGRRTPMEDAAVVARALYAGLFAPAPDALLERRPFVVSAPVDNVTVDEALDRIFEAPPAERARIVHFVHPHALNLAKTDPALAHCFARCDLTLPDGIGLRLAAKLLGVALRHNINGTDLLPLLCDEAARRGVPLALVGAQPGVADRCARNLCRNRPDLRIPVIASGYLTAEETERLETQLRSLGRCIVLVGMGSPRQERFAWNHLRAMDGATVLTVGGLFDFFSERIPRAPRAWQELGLEWAWRLYQEPRRLAGRYLVGNPLFLARAAAQRSGIAAPPPPDSLHGPRR